MLGIALARMLAGVVLFSLAFLPQAVTSFHFVNFSSIAQCGSFQVSFNGGQAPSALPLVLNIAPVNSSNPLAIPIPDSAWNKETETGAAITFLPYPTGTQFIASLEDANGNPTAATSDIIEIQASDNSSCIAAIDDVPPSMYAVAGDLLQCESFTVLFGNSSNGTSITAPEVRAFDVHGFATRLNQTSVGDGNASYLLDVPRGSNVVLEFISQTHNETSALLTVSGTEDSGASCLADLTSFTSSTLSTDSGNISLSPGTIVGIVLAIVGITLIVAALMLIYVRRERRRRRNAMVQFSFTTGGATDGSTNPLPPSPSPASSSVPPAPLPPSSMSPAPPTIITSHAPRGSVSAPAAKSNPFSSSHFMKTEAPYGFTPISPEFASPLKDAQAFQAAILPTASKEDDLALLPAAASPGAVSFLVPPRTVSKQGLPSSPLLSPRRSSNPPAPRSPMASLQPPLLSPRSVNSRHTSATRSLGSSIDIEHLLEIASVYSSGQNANNNVVDRRYERGGIPSDVPMSTRGGDSFLVSPIGAASINQSLTNMMAGQAGNQNSRNRNQPMPSLTVATSAVVTNPENMLELVSPISSTSHGGSFPAPVLEPPRPAFLPSSSTGGGGHDRDPSDVPQSFTFNSIGERHDSFASSAAGSGVQQPPYSSIGGNSRLILSSISVAPSHQSHPSAEGISSLSTSPLNTPAKTTRQSRAGSTTTLMSAQTHQSTPSGSGSTGSSSVMLGSPRLRPATGNSPPLFTPYLGSVREVATPVPGSKGDAGFGIGAADDGARSELMPPPPPRTRGGGGGGDFPVSADYSAVGDALDRF